MEPTILGAAGNVLTIDRSGDAVSVDLSQQTDVALRVLQGVEATVRLRCAPEGAQSLSLTLEPHASVFLLCLAQSAKSGATLAVRARIAEASHLHCFGVTLGSSIDEQCTVEIAGDDAESSIDWIFGARGNEDVRLHVENVFVSPRGRGEISLRGIAAETSHVRAEGNIVIGALGTGTETYLTQRVLMLDTTAKVENVPELKIETNDVRASHSASVSRLTPDDLFYFSSRGIPAYIARRLFAEGFLREGIEKIRSEELRSEVEGLLTDWQE